MNEDWLVFLEPRVQGLPLEADGVMQGSRSTLAPEPGRACADVGADLQSVPVCRSGTELFRVFVVEEHTVHKILDRDAELRVALPFPHVQGAAGVEGDATTDRAADAAGHGLDVPDRNEQAWMQNTLGCHGHHLG